MPSCLLYTKDWDAKAFPQLYPCSKYNLDFEREQKLTAQKFFCQRLLNKDLRFSQNPQFLYGAVAYVEMLQLRRNISISFTKGCPKTIDENKRIYCLDDAYSVLDNTKGTPRYWRKHRKGHIKINSIF